MSRERKLILPKTLIKGKLTCSYGKKVIRRSIYGKKLFCQNSYGSFKGLLLNEKSFTKEDGKSSLKDFLNS